VTFLSGRPPPRAEGGGCRVGGVRKAALAVGLAAFVAILLVIGWRRQPGEETTTLAVPSTTTVTTTTLPEPGLVAVPADDVVTSGAGNWFSPLVAVSAGEVWAVMSPIDDFACVIGHLEDGAWAFWRLTRGEGPLHDLAVSPNGTVWSAGDAGVFSFDGEVWTRRFDGPAGGVAVDGDENVWIGGTLEGEIPTPWLARWQAGQWERLDSSARLPTTGFTPMAAQPGGAVWISPYPASRPGELLRYDGAGLEPVPVGDFPDPAGEEGAVGIWAIEVTLDGNVWVGGWLSADWDQVVLARFDGTAWTQYEWFTDHPGISAVIVELAAGPDGLLWVGGQSGLASLDGTEWTRHVEGRYVRSLDVAPDGTVWYSDDEGLHTLPAPPPG